MAVETIRFRQPGATDTKNVYSGSIWANMPIQAIKDGSTPGVYFDDDFTTYSITLPTTEGNWAAEHGYTAFSSTGGFATADTGQGGGIVIGSDDDNEGVGIRTLATPFKLSRTMKRFACEARMKVSTIANTTFEFFFGLMENTALTATVPITTTAATLADKRLCGLYRTESAGSVISSTYKASGVTAVVVGSGEFTIAANTYFKLGFTFEPAVNPFNTGVGDGGGKYLITFYGDGVAFATQYQMASGSGTDFPNDAAMGPVIATRNAAGSSPGNLTLDKWRFAQLL